MAPLIFSSSAAQAQLQAQADVPVVDASGTPNVYYNPRLDPKNYLDGPLSPNPATRLRQMLARPGIVVSEE